MKKEETTLTCWSFFRMYKRLTLVPLSTVVSSLESQENIG